jgi:Ca2+-binding RTX toxin-like protein
VVLLPDPSESRRLIGNNTSETVTLSIADANNFSLGVWMLGGDDTVNGSAANNLVYGNEGEDALYGNLGNDSLFGGRGKDVLLGDTENDYLSGGQDADIIAGGEGNDILLGGKGNDILFSGNGDDTLIGGLGRDIFYRVADHASEAKKNGSNLYVLQAEPGVTDINNADVIAPFIFGIDRIGLAGGLTASDVVFENLTNVTFLIGLDLPENFKKLIFPGESDPARRVGSGTLIRVKNSGDILGFVNGATPSEIQGSIISVQGF